MKEELRPVVAAEARSWLGTPYHHHGRIKGVGVDCGQILCAVYEEAGVIEHVDPGFYHVEWHLHRSEELYKAWLEKYAVPTMNPRIGDIALFKFGRTFSHGAIIVAADGTMVHSYFRRGVISTRPDEEPLGGRQVEYWEAK